MTIPRTELTTCGRTASATLAATDLAVARRLFATEARGAAVTRALRHVAGDPKLRRAVADDDPVALRAAIIRFFRTPSLHVVRVRATTGDGRLVGDVGGPCVLAPASAPVRAPRGASIGRSFRVTSFTARAFPSGPLHVSLLVPTR